MKFRITNWNFPIFCDAAVGWLVLQCTLIHMLETIEPNSSSGQTSFTINRKSAQKSILHDYMRIWTAKLCGSILLKTYGYW